MCVWSSFANLSISRITSSVRPNSIMVFREPIVNAQELSFLTLELVRSVIFLITFFLSVSVTVWSAETDFGQTDFGHPYLTDFGQTDFGQF